MRKLVRCIRKQISVLINKSNNGASLEYLGRSSEYEDYTGTIVFRVVGTIHKGIATTEEILSDPSFIAEFSSDDLQKIIKLHVHLREKYHMVPYSLITLERGLCNGASKIVLKEKAGNNFIEMSVKEFFEKNLIALLSQDEIRLIGYYYYSESFSQSEKEKVKLRSTLAIDYRCDNIVPMR